MRVCHLTSVHPAEDIRIFVKECQSLVSAGHEVILVVANESPRVINGVKIVGVHAPAKNRLMRMLKATYEVYKQALKEDAEVYHFHDPELIPIGLLLKGKGKKVVYDVHEDVPEQVLSKQWIPSLLRKPISFLVKAVEKFASKRFDAIVTATPTINERFKTYNERSITVHNYPILNELIDPNLDISKKQFEKPSIVYIGGITELRGIREMVQAIETINKDQHVQLHLAGKFSPPELEIKMRKLPAWQYVNYLGWLNRQQIKQCLSDATLGLVLLHPEPRYVVSYPIKLFEYMSAGIPVVASNFPLWKEIVESSGCGKCVDPLNVDEISETIRWFLNHPEKAKEMGMNGRKAIEEKYNWESESSVLIRLYDELSTKRD
ncbi:glycosyltransferase involved in cell wall biosynthesis [Anoxybacillus kamchatkensis]|uniref:glycosyltransferase family 4 protein n=1 Tax=Anoxybacillus ayderensis TaxID=265546 RepID=UPI0015EC7C5B|nr:glycosyltransferase family 4 protein [Anoxybacillus ayderensis]MBA2877228.1 glycosyltransferase involved in cell wall biosynthesis [Anoxybacillus ayderensis]